MGALRRWWPLLAVAALLMLAAATASVSVLPIGRAAPEQSASPNPTPTASPSPRTPTPSPSAPPEEAADTGWLGVVGLVVLLAIGAAVLVVLLKAAAKSTTKFRRRAIREKPPVRIAQLTDEEEVVAALDAGLLDLDDDAADPRTAVIACWVRLEQAAAAAGVPRLPDDTATDLVVRMLHRRRLDAGVLNGFADVYRRARYATHRVDDDMRLQARASLHRLRDELTAATRGEVKA
ncbi:DUF4129 domain-containing protein [Catellatospora coxensis]|uniref:Protein-glutamine gamma-glutamyltransferase-like C-terminal domain-containing protein n=1 Tax=Catellatospora coxensis TaxID=310354 RepID=A0A8J3LCL5_9ACTN|nr:DUF4129 domain-containing protein [Catellatospora coxensis]GIG10245.1 hypothetical protein Cco03nite_69450 [Catellatospora coxensis]